MAGKTTGPVLGFSRHTAPSNVGGTSTSPGGVIFQDTAGNDWYLWVDTAGKVRIADAPTAEAAGFNWLTGGTIVGTQS